jgi:hypothetical protein
MVAALATALALGITLTGHGQGNDKGAPRMDARDRLTARIQALPDDVYLRQDDGAIASLPQEALSAGFAGLALGAPRMVDLGSAQVLPALLLTARSEARSAEVNWRRNAIVVASDVDRGEVFAGEAFLPDPSKSPERDPRPNQRKPAQAPRSSQADALLAQLGHGDSAGTVWLDFRSLLKLPAENRRWALRVLYFDEVSNPALVAVKGKSGGPGAMSAADADKLVARIRAAGMRDGLPRYARSPDTPRLESAGVAATLASSASRGRPIPLHGLMRVELSAPMLVQPAPSGAQGKPPGAVLRGAVLVLMKDESTPVRIPLEVPIWSDRPLKAGELAEAAFSIDLARALPSEARAGTFQVYVIAGRHLSGPHALALIADR